MEQLNKNYCVYEHRNKINGKKYIGVTKQSPPNKRWLNGLGYSESPYFYKAIKLYGWDNFEHIILMDGLTIEQASEEEKKHIALNNSTNHDFGYNLSSGGVLNFTHSDEVLRQMKESNRIYWISQAGIDMKKRLMIDRGFPVYNIELDSYFPCAREAGESIGVSEGAIRACCHGESNSSGGYHWIYKRDISDEKIKEVMSYKKITRAKKIFCKELGTYFESATQAAKFLSGQLGKHVSNKSISGALIGDRETSMGFHWEFSE